MNVFKKLQTCRAELKKLPIKESGNNKFAGYQYMELGDFLPHIVDLCQEHGLCPVISFGDIATLIIVNSDKPEEQIIFESPMSTAELKGCHAIQNLGAVETYLRRYLYVTAFDIVEHDALDSTHGKEPEKKQQPAKPEATGSTGGGEVISEAQSKMVYAKCNNKGIDLKDLVTEFGVKSTKELLKSQLNDVLKWIDG